MEDFVENGTDDLIVSLYQMDLDRSLFLLRSYLRVRLQKVGGNLILYVFSLYTLKLCNWYLLVILKTSD